LFLIFTLGIVAAFILQKLSGFLMIYLPSNEIGLALVLAAVEEFSKASVLLIAFGLGMRREFNQIIDAVLYALVLALGFAAYENYAYFAATGLDWQLVILRSIVTALAHAGFGAVFGLAFGHALFSSKLCKQLPLHLHLTRLLHWSGWWSLRLHILTSHLLPRRASSKGHKVLDVIREGLVLAILLHVLFNLAQVWLSPAISVLLIFILLAVVWSWFAKKSYTEILRPL